DRGMSRAGVSDTVRPLVPELQPLGRAALLAAEWLPELHRQRLTVRERLAQRYWADRLRGLTRPCKGATEELRGEELSAPFTTIQPRGRRRRLSTHAHHAGISERVPELPFRATSAIAGRSRQQISSLESEMKSSQTARS